MDEQCNPIVIDKVLPESFIMSLYKKFKRNARYRNKKFSISYEYLLGVYHGQRGLCFYTGIHLTQINASIDRIDSSVGYVIGNIALCTKHVNISKNKYDIEEFIEMCKNVASNGLF